MYTIEETLRNAMPPTATLADVWRKEPKPGMLVPDACDFDKHAYVEGD